MGCDAARLIRAATGLAWLLACSVRDDTRRSGQSDGRDKQRNDNCARNRHPTNHQCTDSTIVALDRVCHRESSAATKYSPATPVSTDGIVVGRGLALLLVLLALLLNRRILAVAIATLHIAFCHCSVEETTGRIARLMDGCGRLVFNNPAA